MKICSAGLIVFWVSAAVLNVSASADETTTKTERWNGMLERYNRSPQLAKYQVTTDDNGDVHASLILGGISFELKNYTRTDREGGAGEVISFRFKPGQVEVDCVLTQDEPEEEKFVGTCPPDAEFETSGTRRLTMERSSASEEDAPE